MIYATKPLTTRQMYYQRVARGYIENTIQSYKRIAGLINDGKLAGLLDWDALEDRTREFIERNVYNDPVHFLKLCAKNYYEDPWDSQDCRVFCVIEKDALAGVLEDFCLSHTIPLLAARGYPSGTVLHSFFREKIIRADSMGQRCKIIHLADHDPRGIDMSRDLIERLKLFGFGADM